MISVALHLPLAAFGGMPMHVQATPMEFCDEQCLLKYLRRRFPDV